MKRIQSACIIKTIHFQLKDGLAREAAVAAVREEAEGYLQSLERKRTAYRILGRREEPDGSIVMEVKMQYNSHPTGQYLEE